MTTDERDPGETPEAVMPQTPNSRRDTTGRFRRGLRFSLGSQELGLFLAVVVFGTVVTLINPVFLEPNNVLAMLRSAVFVFIVGCAATFVLIGGGLDLSVGSVFAVGGTVAAMLLVAGAPTPVAFVGGVIAGALIGLINGVLIVRFGIPALIVTLGMLYMARGGAQVATGGILITIHEYPSFLGISQGALLGVPYLVIYGLVVGIISHFVLEYTPFGYHIRAVGGNLSASRAIGLPVDRIRLTLYILSGCAAALGGTLQAGRLSVGDPNLAVGFELSVISAVIIGGTSLFGGTGTIIGTALGALLLSMMTNGLIVMRIEPLFQTIVVGAIIIAAVGLDQFRRARAGAQATHDLDVRASGATAASQD